MAELRPDLRFRAVDLEGQPGMYPSTCEFARLNLEREALPWPEASVDAVTCMHLVEHLTDLHWLMREVARVLKPGGAAYFETPHPKTLRFSSPAGAAAGTYTMNFYDDPTHVRIVSVGGLAKLAMATGLEVNSSGTSRNWMFAAAWPLFYLFPASRKKFTAQAHWRGWSAFLIVRRPMNMACEQ